MDAEPRRILAGGPALEGAVAVLEARSDDGRPFFAVEMGQHCRQAPAVSRASVLISSTNVESVARRAWLLARQKPTFSGLSIRRTSG